MESDYTVVFFAAGGRHTPGWNWVWKAYRSLSRKYRKNLKRLVRYEPPHMRDPLTIECAVHRPLDLLFKKQVPAYSSSTASLIRHAQCYSRWLGQLSGL